MPIAIVVNSAAEACGLAVAADADATWEWCGVLVPVIRDTWDADELVVSVRMLLRKSLDGHDVGLTVFEPDQVVGLRLWTTQFEEVHTLISFDGTAFIVRAVTFGMFVWDVVCGFKSEADLCGNL